MSGSGYTREELAQAGAAVRISDPAGTVLHDGAGNHYVSLKTMREIADAILALPPLSAASELVGALEALHAALERDVSGHSDKSKLYTYRRGQMHGVRDALAALKALPCGGERQALSPAPVGSEEGGHV